MSYPPSGFNEKLEYTCGFPKLFSGLFFHRFPSASQSPENYNASPTRFLGFYPGKHQGIILMIH